MILITFVTLHLTSSSFIVSHFLACVVLFFSFKCIYNFSCPSARHHLSRRYVPSYCLLLTLSLSLPPSSFLFGCLCHTHTYAHSHLSFSSSSPRCFLASLLPRRLSIRCNPTREGVDGSFSSSPKFFFRIKPTSKLFSSMGLMLSLASPSSSAVPILSPSMALFL